MEQVGCCMSKKRYRLVVCTKTLLPPRGEISAYHYLQGDYQGWGFTEDETKAWVFSLDVAQLIVGRLCERFRGMESGNCTLEEVKP